MKQGIGPSKSGSAERRTLKCVLSNVMECLYMKYFLHSEVLKISAHADEDCRNVIRKLSIHEIFLVKKDSLSGNVP